MYTPASRVVYCRRVVCAAAGPQAPKVSAARGELHRDRSTGGNMKLHSGVVKTVTAALCGLCVVVGVGAQGVLDTKKGKGGSEVQGAAGTQGAQGAAKDLERCDKPMGAMAVVEPQDYVMAALSRYNLQSPVSLIRMMIQQSNCFIVVERGHGMQNLMQERALAGGGELRGGSNMGGGQMVAADFVLTPSVVFSENNAGGVGAGLGGL